MKVMVDLNVLLDVIQQRDPHYVSSAQVVDAVVRNFIEGVVSSHSITTLHYIISKHLSRQKSCEVIRWVLQHFSVEPATHLVFKNALDLDFGDYEDAVVHTLAESANCDFIITRNEKDFSGSSLSVKTPDQFLDTLDSLV